MNYLNQAKQLLIVFIFLPGLVFGQTLLDIELGVNNVPITEVQFEYNGGTVTQTAGVTTNTAAVDRAIVNYMEIDDGGIQTILYPNNYGSIVVNNNFTAAVGGVGVYTDGNFIPANNPVTWEPAMEQVVNSRDLVEFLYYDGVSNIPSGDDFDILFVKGLQADDYVVVGERNGNTYFTVTPLGADGNPITTGRKLRYGFVNGTSSGNGTLKYDWDIGLGPSNYPAQTMNFTVVDAALFDTGGLPIFGFRIDNNGEADVKFFGLSENSYADNPSNPLIGGLSGNVYNDVNGLVDNTVNGSGINNPDATQLYAILYDNNISTVLDTVQVQADGSYEFLNLDAYDDYGVAISITNGVPGAVLPDIELPADWIYTGDKFGTGVGSDGTPDGDQFGLVVATALVPNVNFGIEKKPAADDYAYAIASPDLNSYRTVGVAAESELTGNDYEEGVFNAGEKFGITSLPTNGNELYYNGTQITLGDNGTSAPTAANPFTINNYDPSLLEIRFTGSSSTTTTFEYITIDAAGEQPDNPATYTYNYTEVVTGGLSGTIFNDADGLVDNTVDGTVIDDPDGSQLYATLYADGGTTVLASQAITATGTYEFLNLVPNSDYSVRLSTNQGTVGAALPAVALPTDWINTGDNLGTGAGNDGVVNGIQTGLSVLEATLPNVNFGIEKLPTADDYTYSITAPDLNSLRVVGVGAESELTGDDEEDGTFNAGETFGIASLPTNGNEIYYNGTQITFGDNGTSIPTAVNPFTINNYDPALLEIKFTGASSTTTSFEYITIDAAGEQPSTPATYTYNYPNVVVAGLSGTVFNDADGLEDNTVDGTGINSATNPLYVTIYEAGTTTVLDTQTVAANGTYLFDDLTPNTDYSVFVSTNFAAPGSNLPDVSIPTNDWIYTGENIGLAAGNDGTPDGIQTDISVGTDLVPNVNFGIERLPTADDYTYTVPNPILNSYMQIGLGAKSGLTGDDEEDGVFDDGEKFGITSLPTNGNELYYNGTQITLGEDGINPPSASNPFVINNYDETLLQIRWTGNGSTTTAFEYVTIDAAGEQPVIPAVYTMNYSEVLSGSLSGTVFNDADGLTDNTVDGVGIDDPETTQLYAILYNATGNEVESSIAIDTDGTFLFEDLVPNPNYGVVISTNQGTVGSAPPAAALPADWVNTGEFRGTGVGNDGTTNGIQTGLTVLTSLLPNVNFGIEKTPTANAETFDLGTVDLDSIWNVGAGVTDALNGTDLEDGTLDTNDKMGITSLPTNGNELYYDGNLVEFGEDGINPPSAANPFLIDSYNPSLLFVKFTGIGSTSTVFKYIVFDSADENSPEVDYTLTYAEINTGSLSGNVFNDADGMTDNTVDGTAINSPDGSQLYAILYDNNISIVLDTLPIAADGSYVFTSLPEYGDYGVAISITNGVIGNALPEIELPTDWIYTGDKFGTGPGNDGTTDGDQFGLTVTDGEVPNVNFGIEKRPEADPYTFGIANPVPDSYFVIGAGATSDLSGDDEEDGALGTGETFGITSLPTSGNEIYYNDIEITLGEDGINPPSASNPFVITNYNPTLLEIRFTGGPQSSTEFKYVSIDAADEQSSEATYELTYNALPVEWAAFDVEKVGESGRIYFATASESKASHFFVQKSLDGKNFRNIQSFEAQGTTTSFNEYEYVDRVLNLGTNYYRIAQIDLDGTIDYTDIKSIVFNADHTTLVYPNPVPVGNSVNIKYYSGEEDVQVVVSDMLGHEIIKTPIQNPAGWNETSVDISVLPAGVYALRVGNRQQAVIFTITE